MGNSFKALSNATNIHKTPQSQPIPHANQVQNSAGGYSWEVDDWTKLDRFLILGTEGGSYYASQRNLTLTNIKSLEACIRKDGVRVVNRIVEISDQGRAPKNDPALFAIVACMKLGDNATKRLARAALPKVARIGTHLFHAVAFLQGSFKGWNPRVQKAFASWYQDRELYNLALQLVKYQQRDGWSHRDVLRLAKPRGHSRDSYLDLLLRYATKGLEGMGDEFMQTELSSDNPLRLIWAHEKAKTSTLAKEIVLLINEYRLPRECIPTQFLNDKSVWEALLFGGGKYGMPVGALVRNLAKMTAVGLLDPMSNGAAKVIDMLGAEELLQHARLHPLQVLVALNTYKMGHGVKGSLTWTPNQNIVDALDEAFYKTFKTVEPTGKRWLLALDVSGSMGGPEIAGMPGITPRIGSAAMAMITARVEKQHHFIGFTSAGGGGWYGGGKTITRADLWSPPGYHGSFGSGNGVSALNISPRQRLDTVISNISGLPFGGTDCSLPMQYAQANNIPVDVFAVYTDSETWAGKIHPTQALREYRQKMGIDARLIVVGMVANKFSIADPNDRGMLDVVGFDTATPNIMSGFAKGEL